MTGTIRFGTDGFRGIIGLDFTSDSVLEVASALLSSAKELGHTTAAVGYDTRFLSREYAKLIADTLSSGGILTYFSESFIPTPALSYFVRKINLHRGVMVTASHNAPLYNGIKVKNSLGASIMPEEAREIESHIANGSALKASPGAVSNQLASPISHPPNFHRVVICSILQDYVENLISQSDLGAIRKFRGTVVFDPMFGSTQSALPSIIESAGILARIINNRADPTFGGRNPEPKEENLRDLRETVLQEQGRVGLAYDGDGDRLAVMDERGEILPSFEIFCHLMIHLVKHRDLAGKVIKTLSYSRMVERVARRLGLDVEVMPVGFNRIAKRMVSEFVLLGGEESGGIGYSFYMPERDGLFSSLLFLEMLGVAGKPLYAVRDDFYKEFGRLYLRRRDVHIKGESQPIVEHFKRLDQFLGIKVKERVEIDGIHLIFDENRSLLLRPSGTEPVIRVYAESEDPQKIQGLLDEAENLINVLNGPAN